MPALPQVGHSAGAAALRERAGTFRPGDETTATAIWVCVCVCVCYSVLG